LAQDNPMTPARNATLAFKLTGPTLSDALLQTEFFGESSSTSSDCSNAQATEKRRPQLQLFTSRISNSKKKNYHFVHDHN